MRRYLFILPLFLLMSTALVWSWTQPAHAGQPQAPTVLGPALNATSQASNVVPTPNTFTTTCASNKSTMNANEQTMLTLTNQLRQSNGVAPLALSQADERSADSHSAQMAQSGTFAHDSYSNTLARTNSCGSAAQSIDENIAGNASGDPTATFNQYVNSPEHKANLLDANMHFVGIAFEQGIYNDGTTVWPSFWMNTMTFSDQDGSAGPTPTPTPQPTATPTPTALSVAISGPTTATVNQSLTFTTHGAGASQPLYYVTFGDNTSAGWQASTAFTHAFTTAGWFVINAYLGDGATGVTSPPYQWGVSVTTAPTPTPTTTPPSSASCAVTRNGATLTVFACP